MFASLRRIRRVAVTLGGAFVLMLLLAPAGRATVVHATAGPWTLTSWQRIPAGHADQGLATVSGPGGAHRTVLRGNADVAAAMAARGWWHIGDPGSRRGYLVDAYQSANPAQGKLFVVTAPDGTRTEWVHHLVPGEMVNNSFAAVSPDGRWLVTGEWGRVSRLLTLPMPFGNPAARPGADLPLAGTITLTYPVRNVQGCSFADPTTLVCATDDHHTDLYPHARQLLAIRLAHPLNGVTQVGSPTFLGALPQISGCGTAETEGIDIHGNTLRVVAHEPRLCHGSVDLFTYTRSPAVGSPDAHPGR